MKRAKPIGSGEGGSAGVAGNARLTALAGIVLLVLFAAEVMTVVLGVAAALTWHVVIGLLLVPPVLVKIGSTGWRIARYYRGDRAYVARGAPRWYLRVLGPILSALTLLLLGSGIVAYFAHGTLYTAALETHKVVFYPWLLALSLHVVPHFLHAVRLSAADLSARSRVAGATARRVTLAAAVVTGLVLAVLLAGHTGTYLQAHPLRLHF